MTDHMISTVPTQRHDTHAFTEANAFLSETDHLPAVDRTVPGQRTVNEVPTQREHARG